MCNHHFFFKKQQQKKTTDQPLEAKVLLWGFFLTEINLDSRGRDGGGSERSDRSEDKVQLMCWQPIWQPTRSPIWQHANQTPLGPAYYRCHCLLLLFFFVCASVCDKLSEKKINKQRKNVTVKVFFFPACAILQLTTRCENYTPCVYIYKTV